MSLGPLSQHARGQKYKIKQEIKTVMSPLQHEKYDK